MTYRKLIEELSKLPMEVLDKQVVVQDYGTNDQFELHRMVMLKEDRHWDGLSIGDYYIEAFYRE
jgi:hypothetical protein